MARNPYSEVPEAGVKDCMFMTDVSLPFPKRWRDAFPSDDGACIDANIQWIFPLGNTRAAIRQYTSGACGE